MPETLRIEIEEPNTLTFNGYTFDVADIRSVQSSTVYDRGGKNAIARVTVVTIVTPVKE